MSLRKSAIIEKAQKLALKGQFGQAIREWEKLVDALPNDGNVYNAIGDLHLKGGQQEQATNFFIKAAEAFQSGGFELKSIAVFKKALKIDPSRIEISEKLAGVYADRGLVGNAIGDYLKAAKAYLGQGNFEASLAVYRKISNLDRENADILLEIAEMCRKEGHNDEAIEEYKKLVAFFKDNDQPSEAEEIIQKIVELDPSYVAQDEVPPEQPEFAEVSEPELSTEYNADIAGEVTHSNILESGNPESAQLEPNSSELLEPEPELMTEEQTIYSTECSVQISDTEEESDSEKSLEEHLTEAEVYIQYELLDKAIQQLQTAALLFPTDPSPQLLRASVLPAHRR